MHTGTAPHTSPPVSTKALWAGRILSAIPVLMLSFSAAMKFAQGREVVEGMAKFGYPQGVIVTLGIVELACVVLYVIPQTSVLGAILMVAYLGGATATHVRVSDTFIFPILLGVVAWLGLYLREPRLRELVPLRKL